MPDSTTLAAFVAAALALLVTPGPAVLYIVARSIDQGRWAGLVSSLGLTTGGLAHVAATALGLSAVLAASPPAFHAMRLAGAAYLVWLGIRTMATRPDPGEGIEGPAPAPLGVVYRDGIVVNLLNPKAAIFFVAFLPQFTDPAAGPLGRQLLALGLLFLGLGLVTDLAYAVLAGSAGGWLRRSALFGGVRRWLVGGVYLALGVAAALSSGPEPAGAGSGDSGERPAPPDLAVVGGRLWTGEGVAPIDDAVVLCRDGRIATAAPAAGESAPG